MKIKKFNRIFVLLYFFSCAVFAETITLINHTIATQKTPIQTIITKNKGEWLAIVAKPKPNYLGMIYVDNHLVKKGTENNQAVVYRLNITDNHTIETRYSTNFSYQFIDPETSSPILGEPKAGNAKLKITTVKGLNRLTVTVVSDFSTPDFMAVKSTSTNNNDHWLANIILPSTEFTLQFSETPDNIITTSALIAPRTFTLSISPIEPNGFTLGNNNTVLSVTHHNRNIDIDYDLVLEVDNEIEVQMLNMIFAPSR
jgi:hypothetical protein